MPWLQIVCAIKKKKKKKKDIFFHLLNHEMYFLKTKDACISVTLKYYVKYGNCVSIQVIELTPVLKTF